ncbi:hypothetical protein [Rhodoferax sp.]|uniref:hypothetical protein n=1 Tax=Rhodoferax sp. TaxID=50421 RepID=UPI00374D3625
MKDVAIHIDEMKHSARSDIDELLRRVYITEQSVPPLLAKLAKAIEDYFDEEDAADEELDEVTHSKAEPAEDQLIEARQEGWQLGLETSFSIVEIEEDEIHEQTSEALLAKAALSRIAKAIEDAQQSTFVDYVQPGSLGTAGMFGSSETELADKPLPRVKPKVVLMNHFPTINHQVSRKEFRKALLDSGAKSTVAANTIFNAIKSGVLEELPNKVLKRVK